MLYVMTSRTFRKQDKEGIVDDILGTAKNTTTT